MEVKVKVTVRITKQIKKRKKNTKKINIKKNNGSKKNNKGNKNKQNEQDQKVSDLLIEGFKVLPEALEQLLECRSGVHLGQRLACRWWRCRSAGTAGAERDSEACSSAGSKQGHHVGGQGTRGRMTRPGSSLQQRHRPPYVVRVAASCDSDRKS